MCIFAFHSDEGLICEQLWDSSEVNLTGPGRRHTGVVAVLFGGSE